jgi:hypothetical protein
MRLIIVIFEINFSKKDIPSINFVIHDTHCHRNIILCNLCDEPVPKSQKDEHFEEYHVKVNVSASVTQI